MNITVILCTFDRCKSLAVALESVSVSELPESVEWEVLVVDNNSTDQTRQVVEEFCRCHPGRFRYLFEPRQGKSHALNAGIAEAKGDLLAFMDDDVTVEPTWLQNLTAELQHGQCVGSGGRIFPKWTCSPPSWLAPDSWCAVGPLAIFDHGAARHLLTDAPVGTNMAFHKKIFEKYGGFRTDLGPCCGSEIRSEDSEFGRRVLAAGERLYYEPRAVVYHSVIQTRLTREYFLKWWFDKGRSELRESGIPRDTKWYINGVPVYLFRRLVRWTLQWIFVLDQRVRFERKLNVWLTAGRILECYRLSLNAKQQKRNPVCMPEF